MSEMIVAFVFIIIWLGLGGYAFIKFMNDETYEAKYAGTLMGFSLLLAPFAAAIAFFDRPKPNPNREQR